MLIADAFLYSRSKSVDYRWIYTNEFVQENIATLNAEYHEFEQSRKEYFSENPLYVRWTPNSINIYRFLETQNTDSNGRAISALVGCSFTGMYRFYAQRLFIPVITYLYFHPEILSPIFEEVSDEMNGLQTHIEIDLNSILDENLQSDDFCKFAMFLSKKLTPHSKKQTLNFALTSSKLKVIADSCPDITKKSLIKRFKDSICKRSQKKYTSKTSNSNINRCNYGYDYSQHHNNKTNKNQIY